MRLHHSAPKCGNSTTKSNKRDHRDVPQQKNAISLNLSLYFTWWPEYQQPIPEYFITLNLIRIQKRGCLLHSKTKSIILGFLLTFSDYFSPLNEKVPMSVSYNSQFCLNSIKHRRHDTNFSLNTFITFRANQFCFILSSLSLYCNMKEKLTVSL